MPLMRRFKKKPVAVKPRGKIAQIPTREGLIKKLDSVFSEFIRLRKADKNGMVKCYTSGTPLHWRSAQCGHFISRRHMATRWDEINCQVQSVAENIFNQGNQFVFGENLKKEYGEKAIQILMLKKNNHVQYDIGTLMILIQSYTEKVKELKKKLFNEAA